MTFKLLTKVAFTLASFNTKFGTTATMGVHALFPLRLRQQREAILFVIALPKETKASMTRVAVVPNFVTKLVSVNGP